MWPLYKNELIKAFSKWRTYISFAAVGIVIPLVMWGFHAGGAAVQRNMLARLGESFITTGNLANGMWASHLIMNALFIHIPFLITLVAGDVVAGEGTAGTLRLYLTRPVSRMRILTAKLLAAATYSTGLVAFMGVLSLVLGNAWLGTGDVFLIDDEGILVLAFETALVRFALAYAFAMYIMLTVTTLTFLFSVTVTNAIGPIVGTMAVLIISGVLTVIDLDALAALKQHLFMTHFVLWQYAFYEVVPWDKVAASLLNLGIYSVVFTAAAFLVFRRKDILS
ncbi:MAG: ABC transporter permease subunit [Candidatus Marinimicrobia bacterium]|nr:ABC transporter permease subunit [Candidatus Neomarinimicrobiota bacterium]